MNLIISYQKYQQPVYTGDQQFLVPQAGGPPLIMQPQMPPVPRQPMFTEEVTYSFREICYFGELRVSVNREFRRIEVFEGSNISGNQVFRVIDAIVLGCESSSGNVPINGKRCYQINFDC